MAVETTVSIFITCSFCSNLCQKLILKGRNLRIFIFRGVFETDTVWDVVYVNICTILQSNSSLCVLYSHPFTLSRNMKTAKTKHLEGQPLSFSIPQRFSPLSLLMKVWIHGTLRLCCSFPFLLNKFQLTSFGVILHITLSAESCILKFFFSRKFMSPMMTAISTLAHSGDIIPHHW